MQQIPREVEPTQLVAALAIQTIQQQQPLQRGLEVIHIHQAAQQGTRQPGYNQPMYNQEQFQQIVQLAIQLYDGVLALFKYYHEEYS